MVPWDKILGMATDSAASALMSCLSFDWDWDCSLLGFAGTLLPSSMLLFSSFCLYFFGLREVLVDKSQSDNCGT